MQAYTQARSEATSVRTISAGTSPRAGFWIRLAAALIDLFLLTVPFCIFVSFLAASMGISNPFFNNRIARPLHEDLTRLGPFFLFLSVGFFALESLFYFAISESSAWRATLGKRLLGLYIADVSGKPVDFWQAALRFCTGRLLVHVPSVGGYYFLLDCLSVAVVSDKRAFHDRLSGCQVLREAARRAELR